MKRAQARSKAQSPDHIQLFTSYRKDRGADSISAKLNKAIRSAGIPKSPKLTAYSLRHGIKEAMRKAGVLNHLQDRIMGHTGEGRISASYGAQRSQLAETKAALEAALDHLGDIDDSIYAEAEKL